MFVLSTSKFHQFVPFCRRTVLQHRDENRFLYGGHTPHRTGCCMIFTKHMMTRYCLLSDFCFASSTVLIPGLRSCDSFDFQTLFEVRRCAASEKWMLTGPKGKKFNFLEYSGDFATAAAIGARNCCGLKTGFFSANCLVL